jgi:hypothetical protein
MRVLPSDGHRDREGAYIAIGCFGRRWRALSLGAGRSIRRRPWERAVVIEKHDGLVTDDIAVRVGFYGLICAEVREIDVRSWRHGDIKGF